jgi:hypothetical protein
MVMVVLLESEGEWFSMIGPEKAVWPVALAS